jgi:hypothetical protein
MTLASLGYVGYGIEGTEGTFVSPTTYLPVTSFSFDDSNDYMVPDQIRGSRDRSIALAGPYSTSGSIDMELVPNGIVPLLYAAFAGDANTISNTSAYVSPTSYYIHTIIPGDDSPYTFTFEGNAGDALIRRYGGIRVNSFEIQSSFGEIVTASFALEGTTRGTLPLVNGATENFAQVVPFHFIDTKIQRNGSDIGNVKSFTFGVNNNIDRIGTLRRTRAYKRTVMGMRDVSLSMTLDFQSDTDYTIFLAEQEFSVTLDFEAGYISGTSGPKYAFKLYIPRVRYNNTSVPISGGDYIEQSVDCQILRPLSGAPIVEVWLQNGSLA